MNKSKSAVTLKFDGKEFRWEVGEYLVPKLESVCFIKQVFPLHGTLIYHTIVSILVSSEFQSKLTFG